ncbi:MAG: ATP-binding protein [Clostridiales bacterium]|nr:ATP-binding protein [Clostridiales bacterium]
MKENALPKKNKRPVILAVSVLLAGLILLAIVCMMSVESSQRDAKKRAEGVIKYIGEQCSRYDDITAEERTKSLVRIIDQTHEFRRDLSYERSAVDDSALERYIENQRLTGMIVTDENAGTHYAYCEDGRTYEDWQEILAKYPGISGVPTKSCADRLFSEDGKYCYDYAVIPRSDVKGVILCYQRQNMDSVVGTQLSIRTLLSGYEFETDGIVAVTDGTTIIGSNQADWIEKKAEDCELVRKVRESDRAESFSSVSSEEGRFFAMRGKSNDYFIYVFCTYRGVYMQHGIMMTYTVVFYLILVACVFAVRHKLIVSGRREMQERETEYRNEYDRLESDARVANNVKTDFLRRMSHDIRTPINGIRGMLDIADYYADDLQKQQECRDKIREASGYLLELVNDILDMSKLESGEIVWKDEPFDLRQVLREITSITKLQAAERNIDFSVVEDNIVHAKLIGSTVLLKRICFNLIGNALKYNKENGWLRVSCNEIAFDGESGEYEFVCADSGIGMSEEFQKRMYEPFAQEDPSFKNSYGGSGLGLAIVKKLVDALGGTIDVQSTRGVGTTFTVRLRFKTDKEAANGNADTAKEIAAATEDTAKTAGEKKPLAGVKILLAEDNELNLEIARFMLTTAGAQVDEVYNGRAALDTYLASEEGHYDVLLMDVMMPVMDGLRATKLIRASKRKDASSLPIFAMTANAFSEDIVRVREAGMNEHCPKPLNRDKLIAMILKYVHRRKKS